MDWIVPAIAIAQRNIIAITVIGNRIVGSTYFSFFFSSDDSFEQVLFSTAEKSYTKMARRLSNASAKFS